MSAVAHPPGSTLTRPADDRVYLHALVAMLAVPMAFFGAYVHFVMIDRFVVVIVLLTLVVSISEMSLQELERALRTPASLLLFVYLAMYLWQIRWGLAAASGRHASREYYETFTLCSYFLFLNVIVAMRNTEYLQTLMVWFVTACLAIEFVTYAAGVNVLSNPNIYGYLIFASLPFIHSRIVARRLTSTVLILGLALVAAVVFKSRAVFLAIGIYGIVIAFWRQISATRTTFALFVLSFVAALLVFLYFYIFRTTVLEASALLKAGDELVDKNSFGRLPIWVDLVVRIAEAPVWGHCSNCNTEFFSIGDGSRNLSSHSTYLEILFRSGIVGLGIYLSILAALIKAFLKFKSNQYAVMGIAYIMGSMWLSSVYEYTMFSYLSVNVLFWIAIALLLNLARRTTPKAVPTHS